MELEGRVAFVTGAARGIGRAIAVELARAGADIAVADLHLDPFQGESYGRLRERWSGGEEDVTTGAEVEALGRRCLALEVDVADADRVEAAVSECAAALGPVDVLVNNAGITTNFVSLARTKPEEWAREIGVNLSGAFHCMRATVPAMAERGWGRVVSISSLSAERPGLHPAYAASKAGVLGLTRAVAKEYAATGVTVNAVMPGMTATELVRALPGGEEIASSIPARRYGEPAEVAAVVRFLASPSAGYVTGVAIPCDGGWMLGSPGDLGAMRRRPWPEPESQPEP